MNEVERIEWAKKAAFAHYYFLEKEDNVNIIASHFIGYISKFFPCVDDYSEFTQIVVAQSLDALKHIGDLSQLIDNLIAQVVAQDQYYSVPNVPDNGQKAPLANQISQTDWFTPEVNYEPEEPEEAYSDHIEALFIRVNSIIDSRCCRDDYEDLVAGFFRDSLAWVRNGVQAHIIKLKKIYTQAEFKLKSFKEFCEKVLKRSTWSVNRNIEAAYVMVCLARAGFDVDELPQNLAQAATLTKFVSSPTMNWLARSSEEELISKWHQVLDKLQPHEFSVTKIAAIVDPEFVPLKQPGVRIGSKLRERLLEESSQRGSYAPSTD